MSESLDYRALAALARKEAKERADARFPPFDERKAEWYKQEVLRQYIDRISPLTWSEVLLG